MKQLLIESVELDGIGFGVYWRDRIQQVVGYLPDAEALAIITACKSIAAASGCRFEPLDSYLNIYVAG